MHTLPRLAALVIAAAALVGCAAPHYNLDIRNMSSQPVNLQLTSENGKIDGGARRTVATATVGPGANVSMFAEGEKGDKNHELHARIAGDDDAEPATLEIGSGLTQVDIIPAGGSGNRQIRLRETIRE